MPTRLLLEKADYVRTVVLVWRFGLLKELWVRFWMKWAGLSTTGRLATRLATLWAPPHKARLHLVRFNPKGYVDPTATIYHERLNLGDHVFIGERVVLFQAAEGGPLKIGNDVALFRDCILETGQGGTLIIEDRVAIHPRCQINAYVAPIHLGKGVIIAPNCALYSYNHGIRRGCAIAGQPLESKGGIYIGDEAWLGVGVIVLSGVRIGRGAVVGAGSVVTQDIPDEGIAVGAPARLIGFRGEDGSRAPGLEAKTGLQEQLVEE